MTLDRQLNDLLDFHSDLRRQTNTRDDNPQPSVQQLLILEADDILTDIRPETIPNAAPNEAACIQFALKRARDLLEAASRMTRAQRRPRRGEYHDMHWGHDESHLRLT